MEIKKPSIFDRLLNKLSELSFLRVLIVLLVFFICILVAQKCMIDTKEQEIRKKDETIKILTDSAVVWKDEKGREHLKIETIVGLNQKAILELESTREDVKHLQEIIKEFNKALSKKGSSVTVTKPSVKFDSVLKTDDRTKEILKDSILRQKIVTEWVNADYGFSKDSTWLKFLTFDKLSLINSFERKNFLSPYKMSTELISENPNIKYEYLKGWSNSKLPDKKWIVGPALLIGVDKDLKFNYLLGGGIMYKLGSF